MENLQEVNKILKQDAKSQAIRKYYQKYPERKKLANKKWNDKHRAEYQHNYRIKQAKNK